MWLPGKRLPFIAEIRRLVKANDSSGDRIIAYGCVFNWLENAIHDQLDRYLFGSGLQWQIQGLQERKRTPLQWLSDQRNGNRDVADNEAPCWKTFVYCMPGSTGADEMVGLIEVVKPWKTSRKVLLYHPINKGVRLSGRVITELCDDDITLCVTDIRQVETQLTPVFMITAEACLGSVTAAEPVKVIQPVAANTEDASKVLMLTSSHARSVCHEAVKTHTFDSAS